jgi:uncharacterized protein YkwD
MPAVTTPLCGRWIAMVGALLAGTVLLLSAPAANAMAEDQCPGAAITPSAQTLGQAAGAVVCLVNVERAQNGLPVLLTDIHLAQAAARHSRDMVRRAFFSHVTPSGVVLSDRLRRGGYIRPNSAWEVGEAIGWGSGTLATPDATVVAWISSPPHKRILLGGNFRNVGVGVAAGAPESSTAGVTGTTYTLDAGVSRDG